MGNGVGKSREAIKAALLEFAERRIEEVLSYGEKAVRPTLSEIEGKVPLYVRPRIS